MAGFALSVANRGITLENPTGGSSAVAPIVPERYGAGYAGAAADDWGAAIRQAIVTATAASTYVLLRDNYDVRTTVTWPAGSQVPIQFASGAASLTKLADVVLIDMSGTNSGAGQAVNRWLFGPGYLIGGNNTGWHQPLLRMNFTGGCGTSLIHFYQNYGPAIDMTRQAWDVTHNDPQILFCGAQDGVNAAVMIGSTAGDGANATNCVTLHNPLIEAFRTGAVWAQGASATDKIFETMITGRAKIELGGGAGTPIYGPAIKLNQVKRYFQNGVRFTCDAGTPGTGQTTPFDAFMNIANSTHVQLGEMEGDIGGLTSAAQVASLINFAGGNHAVSYDELLLNAGGGSTTNKPACVWKWSGTNELVRRGSTVWDNSYMLVPMDSGSPTNFGSYSFGTSTQTPGAVTTVNIPHLLGDINGSDVNEITPSWWNVRPANANAWGAPAITNITVNATNLIVTFAAALTAATSYAWNWEARA